jgi:hypothetical protein
LLLFHQYYWSTVDSYEHLGSVIQEVMKIWLHIKHSDLKLFG